MKVILARTSGFCMGVRRAMNMVLDEAHRAEKPVYTHGPLIHNPQVIELLATRGVTTLGSDEIADCGSEGTVVIRAHGIAPGDKQAIAEAGFEVVDATCPHVLRIHKLIARHIAQGDSIVIVGDKGHAEVDGLLGGAGDRGFAVSTLEDVDALPDMESVCVVSQTTQSHEHFDAMLARIQARWPDATVHRTICNSTKRRQEATVEIARASDAMIVVGGRNSANTVRLAELSAETGTPTYHIETSEELDVSKLRGAKLVGMTAGASTPNWMIVEVMERLAEISRSEWPAPARFLFRALQLLLDTNLYLALGAMAMAYGCAALLGLSPAWRGLEIGAAALYVLAMYSLHLPLERETVRFCNPLRWRFHEKSRHALLGMGMAALCASLVLSAGLGLWAFLFVLLANLAGVVYRLTVVPAPIQPLLKYRRLIDIPGSKDIFMGLAWASMLCLLPLLARSNGDGTPILTLTFVEMAALGVTFLFAFTLVFTRSVLFAVRDIQGDQMVGRETIPIVLGVRRTKQLLMGLTGLAAALLVVSSATGILPRAGFLMLLAIGHTWTYLYLYHRRVLTQGVIFEALAGMGFLLVGLLALARLFLP